VALETYFLIGGSAVASLGAVPDVRTGRIPNWFTYSGLIAGLLLRLGLSRWPGFRGGLLGVLVGGGLFYVLMMVGGMGGGDVKLMAAVSAWAGVAQIFLVLIATAIAGGILALFYIFFRRQVWQTLRNSIELMRHHLTRGLRPHPELNIHREGSVRVPYGLAIALGTLYCLSQTLSWR
jgi:prepilin peptidase CpaA